MNAENSALEADGMTTVKRSLTRRALLAGSGALAGGLVIAAYLPDLRRERGPKPSSGAPASFAPNAYVRVGQDGVVTIVVALVEMGQGTYTSIPMLIAEELEVDVTQVHIEHAPADEKLYGHPLFGLQITGGSTSVQAAWKSLRQAGAAAKTMLVSAAAMGWDVPATECRARDGAVSHMPSGRSIPYGELAAKAALLPVPKDPPLKDPASFTLVGTAARRTDTASKIDGSALFGIDVRLPHMKVAAVALCPYIGGDFISMDTSRARDLPGVRAILSIKEGVAVVADHYGAAKKALAALFIIWREGPNRSFTNKVWSEQLEVALEGRGVEAVHEGDTAAALATAVRRIDATYEAPPLAHAAMETLNCTVQVLNGACDVWVGTQAPARAQKAVAEVLNIAPDKVVIYNHLIGGGFGRKLDVDHIETAAKFARQVTYPLKVIFSREEDMQHDAYRPYFRDELSAALDGDGRMTAFSHRIAGSSVLARYAPVWLNNGLDGDAVHAAESPYAVPNKRVEFVAHEPPLGLLTGNWRGVGPTHNAFVNECFIDEIAALVQANPLSYRSRMLDHKPRALAVLRLAAEKAGWDGSKPQTSGRGIGISLVEAWDSYAALVTELAVLPDGSIKLHRLVCAVDCGLAINPDGIEAQMQGGMVFGLTAVLYGTLTFDGGRVAQSNFHDYRPLRINEMPKVEVHRIASTAPPGGVGEIGTAVVAPSVLNAIYSATGKRFRTYPVLADDLKRI